MTRPSLARLEVFLIRHAVAALGWGAGEKGRGTSRPARSDGSAVGLLPGKRRTAGLLTPAAQIQIARVAPSNTHWSPPRGEFALARLSLGFQSLGAFAASYPLNPRAHVRVR